MVSLNASNSVVLTFIKCGYTYCFCWNKDASVVFVPPSLDRPAKSLAYIELSNRPRHIAIVKLVLPSSDSQSHWLASGPWPLGSVPQCPVVSNVLGYIDCSLRYLGSSYNGSPTRARTCRRRIGPFTGSVIFAGKSTVSIILVLHSRHTESRNYVKQLP